MRNKIIEIDELKNEISQLKKEGKKISSTSGCFDILHAGHITYLEQASKFGDIFVVFLNSDDSVRGLKGDKRPIVPQNERAKVLAALHCVDYVCIFDETTPCRVIEKTKPDFFVKGGDYEGTRIPEIESMEKHGGKVEFVSLLEGCSTTNIIEKILEVYGSRMI